MLARLPTSPSPRVAQFREEAEGSRVRGIENDRKTQCSEVEEGDIRTEAGTLGISFLFQRLVYDPLVARLLRASFMGV